jgi:hypothetical protein
VNRLKIDELTATQARWCKASAKIPLEDLSDANLSALVRSLVFHFSGSVDLKSRCGTSDLFGSAEEGPARLVVHWATGQPHEDIGGGCNFYLQAACQRYRLLFLLQLIESTTQHWRVNRKITQCCWQKTRIRHRPSRAT